MAEKPREIAVRLLRQHAQEGGFIEQILEKGLASKPLAQIDRALAQELVFGVVRWQETLDWLIARKTRDRTQKIALQILLRLGLYQMFWLERIPDHAAVHETVQLAKSLGFGAQSGFVNAVLRGYLRERETTERTLAQLKISEPAVGYSHPQWLYARWKEQFGEDNARKLLEWDNTPPATFARLNTLKGSPEKLAKIWEEEGVHFFPRHFDWIPGELIFELKSHPPLASLPSFDAGWFYIQDPSTLLAPSLLAPQAGEVVLDMCAAPGGKTTFMAQLMEDRGLIIAQEPHVARREMVRRNCDRLGIHCVQISPELQQLGRPCDRILIDAPCSNSGVVRRRVDLRWRIQPEEIARLRRTQQQLLASVRDQLRKGGTVVYSTCSLEPEENRDLIQEFLSAEPSFRLETEKALLPFTHGVDGAYVALLEKTA